MAAYKTFVLTEQGKKLLEDLISGEGELEFRYLATGSGEYEEAEKNRDQLQIMKELKKERQQASFFKISKEENGLVGMKASVDNRELTEGYSITEIGIYAGKKGETEKVLYCVAVVEGKPDYMPEDKNEKAYSVVFNVKIGIGEVEKVTINWQQDTYLWEVIGEKGLSDIGDGTITGAIQEISSNLGKLEDLKTEDKSSLVEAINELKELLQKLQESRVTCTQAEYDAMSEKKDDVIYVIVG
ncbi:MAG: hypothetical protein NC541_10920 [bacterium]|nr:hypothetical protein [bacterium]